MYGSDDGDSYHGNSGVLIKDSTVALSIEAEAMKLLLDWVDQNETRIGDLKAAIKAVVEQ